MKKRHRVKAAIIVLALLGTMQAMAQDTLQKQKYIQNRDLESELGYTHAIKAGNTIYVSGTTGTGNMQDQVAQIMDDIQGTLQRFGVSFKNVVRETVYTTNLDSFMTARKIRTQYYGGDFPTTSWVEVKRLLLPQFLVMIEVTAVLPEPKPQIILRP